MFTGQLSLWGRVGVTVGLCSVLHEGQRHWWRLIKQLSLKRQMSVSQRVLYPSEERLVSWIQGCICCSKQRHHSANTSKCPWWNLCIGWDLLLFTRVYRKKCRLIQGWRETEALLPPSNDRLKSWKIMSCQRPEDLVSLHHLWGERLLVMVCHRNNPFACSSIRQWNKLSGCVVGGG